MTKISLFCHILTAYFNHGIEALVLPSRNKAKGFFAYSSTIIRLLTYFAAASYQSSGFYLHRPLIPLPWIGIAL